VENELPPHHQKLTGITEVSPPELASKVGKGFATRNFLEAKVKGSLA